MFTLTVQPRFSDTDLLGHVNNRMLAVWFEQARDPIFRIFTPDLGRENWRVILARTEYDFHRELFYGSDVEIGTGLVKVGNSSMTIRHEARQNGALCATGTAVLVHYDFARRTPVSIPDDIRGLLEEHLLGGETGSDGSGAR